MHKAVLWVQTVLVPTLGTPGMALVAFFDSSFLSLPEINDILVVSAAAARPSSAWLAVVMTTVGSLAGCLVLWAIGRRGGEALLLKRFGVERIARTRGAFERWGVLALAVPAVLPPPMPFKVFVLSAGVFGVSWRRLLAVIAIARGLRYSAWAVLGAVYGQRAVSLLRAADAWFASNVWPLLALVLAAVVIGLGAWWWRRRASELPPPPLGPDRAAAE